ncbi:hypothetical protein [Streptococcus sp. 596553]|uniref:hypothetical protein n=1 Tax=Streptococcus sp. 596553 TaxID=2250596 RepID=UPI000DD99DF9|nr:hypothetical protein [Streptococcus sp. 596553]
MATREGIYVGGHEIIERYVGSKLVWQKWRFLKRFNNLKSVFIYPHSSNTVAVDGNFISLASSFDSENRKLKLINYSNYDTEVFYANRVYVYTRYSGENNYIADKQLHIEFDSNQEASDFKQRYHSGTIDIYIR